MDEAGDEGLRVAVFYAPAADDPLSALGAAWLGRDPSTNHPLRQPDLPDIVAITADARRYGFHGTLKPPFRLVRDAGWQNVLDAARTVAAAVPRFDLPPLAVASLDGFLALRETAPCTALQALADACVAGLDHLRARPSEAELARRRRSRLAPAQDANLVRWGYPYVFATWFFHITLTRRLGPAEDDLYRPAARSFFAPEVAKPRRIDDICLFAQEAAGQPFTLRHRLALRG